MYCPRCGILNNDANERCARCGGGLPRLDSLAPPVMPSGAPAVPPAAAYYPPYAPAPFPAPAPATPEPDLVQLILPYKNIMGFSAYYVGICGLFPLLGLPFAIGAIFLGIKGCRAERAKPAIRGRYHAITGIVLGALGALFSCALLFILISMASHGRLQSYFPDSNLLPGFKLATPPAP